MIKSKISKLVIISISFLMSFILLISSNSQTCVAANSNPFANHEFKKVSYRFALSKIARISRSSGSSKSFKSPSTECRVPR